MEPRILSELESDMSRESAALFTDLIADYFAATRAGEGPVSTALGAAELAGRFDEPLPRAGRPLATVAERLAREVIPDSNHLWHPRYVGHQVSSPLPAAVWTDALVSALNQSVAVWEMSPVATVLEARVVRWLCDLVGFGAGSGGTLTTGGTEATFAALLAARSAAIPDVWQNGVGAEPPVVVCGEHAHYAVTRAAGQLGLGMRSVVAIPSRRWRMDVAELERTLDRMAAEGRKVMAVVATAGSTATGSFDDLEAIGATCERRGLWLHVDAAHGGSALLSAAHRHRLTGLARARSVAWDPHKMMLLPLQAGLVLVRRERDLEAAFAQHAPYLFHGSGGERVVDQGVRSFLCSRRADVLKIWVALQRYGADGFGALYDHLCDTTRAFHAMLVEHPAFEPLHEPECNILCFRWSPERSEEPAPSAAKGAPGPTAEDLDAMNLRLRERFNRSGAGWITTTVLGGRRVLRVTIMNPRTTTRDLRAILDALAVTAEG